MPKRDVDEMDLSQDSEIDEKGEMKVDEDGELLQGRQYKIPTFNLPRHPSRLYMLTVDVAKILGFKDTHFFLSKNPSFPKLAASDEDREALEEQDLVPSQLRGKTISILPARSVFKKFGYKIIKKGKAVRDDYFVGDREEQPDPVEKRVVDVSKFGDFVRDYVEIYKDFPYRPNDTNRPNPAYLEPLDGPEGLKKDDWMYRCVLSAAEFNRTMAVGRPKRFWDPHTNIEHVPRSTQPTRAFVQASTTYDPLGPGKVNVNVHISDKDDPNWKELELDEVAAKYPIAVIPGQRQYAFSVFSKRFGVQKKKQILPPAEIPPAPVDETKPNNPEAKVINPESLNEAAEPPRKKVKGPEHAICGATRATGAICQKPVARAGERCAFHNGQMEEDEKSENAAHENACVHCHQEYCPETSDSDQKIPGDLLLSCSVCNSLHHPICIELNDPVLICKVQNYDWHCSNCKVCQKCNSSDNDDKLMFCDLCDRGYHTYCLEPPLNSPPEGSWLCELCAVCISCKKRPTDSGENSDLKHIIIAPENDEKQDLGTYIATYCGECDSNFKADRFCPLCFGTYAADSDDLPMACCDKCDRQGFFINFRWIHVGCDPDLTDKRYEEIADDESALYTCVLCEKRRLSSFISQKRNEDGMPRKSFKYHGKLMISPALVFRPLSTFSTGYHAGVINAPRASMSDCSESVRNCIPMNDLEWGIFVSLFVIGGIIGSFAGGPITKVIGRLFWNNIFFLTGCSLLYFGSNFISLCAGRLFVGFGSGVSTAVVPLYIAEISPLDQRGINGSFAQLSIVIGILISAIAGIPFSTRESWRELFAIAIVPVVFQMIFILFIAESPLWLVMQNEHDHARAALQQVRGLEDVEDELDEMLKICGRQTSETEGIADDENIPLVGSSKKSIGFIKLWREKELLKPLMAATGLQIIQQGSGINAAIYYSTTIFRNSYPPEIAIKLTLLISIINLVSTVISMILIDRYGRRSLLLSAEITMAVFAILITIFDSWNFDPIYIVLSLLLFVFGFGLGLGSIPWLIVPELIPRHALDVSSSICSGTNWIFNFILALVMPVFIRQFAYKIFIIFASFLISASAFTYFMIPETMHRSL